jgi:glyceraldehyde 3-phosphate dehydrogenase
MMVKIRVNKLGCIGCLVTRAANSSGKVNIVAINDPFIDLIYIVKYFCRSLSMASSRAHARLRMGSLPSKGNSSSYFRSKVPLTPNEVMLTPSMLCSLLEYSPP